MDHGGRTARATVEVQAIIDESLNTSRLPKQGSNGDFVVGLRCTRGVPTTDGFCVSVRPSNEKNPTLNYFMDGSCEYYRDTVKISSSQISNSVLYFSFTGTNIIFVVLKQLSQNMYALFMDWIQFGTLICFYLYYCSIFFYLLVLDLL